MLSVRGSRILSTNPCAADVSSLLIVGAAKEWVSCIDASGELRLLPVDSSSASSATTTDDTNSNADAALVRLAVCQVEVAAGSIWVGCSDKRGIMCFSLSSSSSYSSSSSGNNTKTGPTLRCTGSLEAFNNIVTHLCLVPGESNSNNASSSSPVVASVGTQGVAATWDTKERSCLVSVQLPDFAPPALALASSLDIKSSSSSSSSAPTMMFWFCDSKGALSIVDAATLVPIVVAQQSSSADTTEKQQCATDINNNNSSSTSSMMMITCLLSPPGIADGVMWAGDEGGRIQIFGSADRWARLKKPSHVLKSEAQAPSAITALASSNIPSSSAATSNNDARCVWAASLNGALVLWDPCSFSQRLIINGTGSSSSSPVVVSDFGGGGGSSSSDAASPYTCTMVCLMKRNKNKTDDDLLICGGTSKIVTLQTVVMEEESKSPDRGGRPLALAPATRTGNSTTAPQHQSQQQQQQQQQQNRNEAKVNALMKRVAELELDLMQAQAVGAELTKRLLTRSESSPSPNRPPPSKQQPSSAAVGKKADGGEANDNGGGGGGGRSSVSAPPATSFLSASPHRNQPLPKVQTTSVGTQVLLPTSSANNTAEQNDADDDVNAANNLAAEYALRVEELETDNVALRERLASAEAAAGSALAMASSSSSADSGSPRRRHSSSPTRPMDDYELRCMQRLILENERLREDLAAARQHHQTYHPAEQHAAGADASSGSKGSNTLTVCFLTLRSVLGHHRASEIMLSAIGDEEEQHLHGGEENVGGDEAGGGPSEVETMEKLVFELAARIDPRGAASYRARIEQEEAMTSGAHQ